MRVSSSGWLFTAVSVFGCIWHPSNAEFSSLESNRDPLLLEAPSSLSDTNERRQSSIQPFQDAHSNAFIQQFSKSCQENLRKADMNHDRHIDASEFTTFISWETNDRYPRFNDLPTVWKTLFDETASRSGAGIAFDPLDSRDSSEEPSLQICNAILRWQTQQPTALSFSEKRRRLENSNSEEPDEGRRVSRDTLGILYRIAAALSLLGTLLVLTNVCLTQPYQQEECRGSSRRRLLASLQVVNLVTSIVWIVGDWLWPRSDATIDDKDDNLVSCKAIGVGLHFGFWTVTMYLVVLVKAIWLQTEGFSDQKVFQTLERPAHILIFLFASAMALLPLALDLYQPYPWNDSFVCAVAPSESKNALDEELGYYYMFWGFQGLFTVTMIVVLCAALTAMTRKFFSGESEDADEDEIELDSDSTSAEDDCEAGYQLSEEDSETSSSSEGSGSGYAFKEIPPTLIPWRRASTNNESQRNYFCTTNSKKKEWQEREIMLLQGFGYSVVFVMCCLIPTAFFCITEILTQSRNRENATSLEYASWVYMAFSLPLNGFLTSIFYFLPRMGQTSTPNRITCDKIPLEDLLLAICWPEYFSVLKKSRRKPTVLKEPIRVANGEKRIEKSFSQLEAVDSMRISRPSGTESTNLHDGDSARSDYQQNSTISSGLDMEDYDFQSAPFGFHQSRHEEEEIVFCEAHPDEQEEDEEIVFSRDDEEVPRKPLISWDPFEENGSNDDDDSFYAYLDRILFGGTDFDRTRTKSKIFKDQRGNDSIRKVATDPYHPTRNHRHERQASHSQSDYSIEGIISV